MAAGWAVEAGLAGVLCLATCCIGRGGCSGVTASGLGAALHAVALGLGSLSAVQPLGITGLLFALPIGAALNHHRVPGRDVVAALIVIVGLAGLLLVMMPSSIPAPVLSGPQLAGLAGSRRACQVAVVDHTGSHRLCRCRPAVVQAAYRRGSLGACMAIDPVVAVCVGAGRCRRTHGRQGVRASGDCRYRRPLPDERSLGARGRRGRGRAAAERDRTYPVIDDDSAVNDRPSGARP